MKKDTTPPHLYVSYLTEQKKPWQELTQKEKDDFSPFVVNKFLAQHMELVRFLNELQRGKQLPKHIIYNIYLKQLPSRSMYTKFIKKSSEDLFPREFLKLICKHKNCDIEHAKYFVENTDISELKRLLHGFHIDNKLQTKWLKKKSN